MIRNEYLILSYVVSGWEPVAALTMEDEDFEGWFNASPHGMSQDEVGEGLLRLFRQGDLVARWRNKDDFAAFIPTASQVVDALAVPSLFHEDLFDYGLTTQGGRRWESVTHPDWSRYLSARGKWQEIISLDRSRAQQYLQSQGLPLVRERWDTLRPWQATYWKTLTLWVSGALSVPVPGPKLSPCIHNQAFESRSAVVVLVYRPFPIDGQGVFS